MTKAVVTPANLGDEFDIGVIEANKIHVKIDGTTIVRNAGGELEAIQPTLTPADLCNLLKLNTFDDSAKPIFAEVLFLTSGPGGGCVRGNIGTIAASFETTDCNGAPLDLWKAALAQCSDIQDLQTQLTNLKNQFDAYVAAHP